MVLFGTVFTAGAVVGMALMVATQLVHQLRQPAIYLPEKPLHASASYASDTMAAATGLIDENIEGLYTLDFLTGELQCAVLSYRAPSMTKFVALHKKNVIVDLGIEKTKKPNYMLVTGVANFQKGGGSNRPGATVAYVIDANTGRYAAYGISWNASTAARGQPQIGPLILLDRGNARQAMIRQ